MLAYISKPDRCPNPHPLVATIKPSCHKNETARTSATALRTRCIGSITRLRLRLLGLVSPQTAACKGADLFSTPTIRRDYPGTLAGGGINGATRSTLQVNDHELVTYVWGDPRAQPYVLLAHGWSSRALHHLALIGALHSAGYAVVAFDQQAHGLSSGDMATLPDFVCNLRAIGWQYGRAKAVIGHSLGGTATAIALSQGLDAERAILISAIADPEDATRRFAHRVGLAGPIRRRMVAVLERRTGVAIDELQAHRAAPKIARPALVVHDLEDSEVPWAEGERYARYWPQSRLLTTTGLGHRRLTREPVVIEACLQFLRGQTVGERVVSSSNLPYGMA